LLQNGKSPDLLSTGFLHVGQVSLSLRLGGTSQF
jgi:hypothetical protein